MAFLFLAVSVVAIGLGRMFPENPRGRLLDVCSQVYVSPFASPPDCKSVRFLEPESGKLTQLELPESDVLDQASCSPWHDERGDVQVVGRWSRRLGSGMSALGDGFGLARVTYPSGRVLERFETSVVPASPPCWFPGTTAKILFAAGDGMLYRFAFEGATGSTVGRDGRDEQPVPLEWRPGVRPGIGRVYIRDVCWPADARLGGRFLVTLSPQARVGTRIEYMPSTLWWLSLDKDGTTIESATPVLPEDHADGNSYSENERMPTMLHAHDGPPLLAYLSRRLGTNDWKLQVAPVRLAGTSTAPKVLRRDRRTVAERCFPTPPALSSDGRWVLFIREEKRRIPQIQRIPVGDIGRTNDFVGRPVEHWDGVASSSSNHAPALPSMLRDDRG